MAKLVVDAGERLFFTAGSSRTSLDDLALEVRISKKTIYRYFPENAASSGQCSIGDLLHTGHLLGALSTPAELLSVITRGALESLLASELPLALDRSAAGLSRETAGVMQRGALAPDGGRSGPGDRSSAPGTPRTLRRPA
jgi:AcrR family transcriptional regulator